MPQVKVYTTNSCPYCHAAKRLLKDKGVDFEEINVENDEAKRGWLKTTTGQRTVPQIFIKDQSIGGFAELRDLEAQGKLDALLKP
jgi:glutaredoxin 3